MTIPPGQMSREQVKARLDRSLRLHREWSGWVSSESSGAVPRQQQTATNSTAAETSGGNTNANAAASSVFSPASRLRSAGPVSALRRASSASRLSTSPSPVAWTPISRSNDIDHHQHEHYPLPEGGSPQRPTCVSEDLLGSFAGLSAGEVLSLAGLREALSALQASWKAAGSADLSSSSRREGITLAAIEALGVIIRAHPLLGPIVGTVFDWTSKALFAVPLPFLCEAGAPPHQASGSDSPASWTNWVEARALRLGRLHSHRLGALSVTGATLLLSNEMSQMSDELRANRITAQASQRNAQQLKLNYIQARKTLMMHFKAWRDTMRNTRSKALAAHRIASKIHEGIKRTSFNAWRILTLQDMLGRKRGHCERLGDAMVQVERQLEGLTGRFDDNQRQRDIAVANVEHIRAIAADLERRLAHTKSPMVIDFRRPITILHKSGGLPGNDVLDRGTVHFHPSTDSFPSSCCEDWFGEYGCERLREGVAMPGKDKYSSRYHIRVEGLSTRAVPLDPTLEWANQTVIGFCRANMPAKATPTSPFGKLHFMYDQYLRVSEARIGIWQTNAVDLRDTEKDNIVQVTQTGTVSLECELNAFADLAGLPFVYAALLSEVAPLHVLVLHRTVAGFVGCATLPSIFAVLKMAGMCGGILEAEFTEARRGISGQLREAIHRLVLCRIRAMALLKAPWETLALARNPAPTQQHQHQQPQQPPLMDAIGVGPSGVFQLRKGPTLGELVVQRSATDGGLVDETASDVLAWVREVFVAAGVPRAASPSPPSTALKPRRRVIPRKTEEALVESKNVLAVGNLEEDMGDGLWFLALVVQCLLPYDAALSDMSNSTSAVPPPPVGPGSLVMLGGVEVVASIAGFGGSVGKRSLHAGDREQNLGMSLSATGNESTNPPMTPETGEIEGATDEAENDNNIPTDTMALATYLCATVRDALHVQLPALVWATLHTCSRSIKMLFLTALFLKFNNPAGVSGSANVMSVASAGGAAGTMSPALSPRRLEGSLMGSPRRLASARGGGLDSPRGKGGSRVSKTSPTVPVALPGTPAMLPATDVLRQFFSTKEITGIKKALLNYSPLLAHVFVRLATLRGPVAGALLASPSSMREVLAGQEADIRAALDAYLLSEEDKDASLAGRAPNPKSVGHLEVVMALLHVAKSCASSRREPVESVLNGMLGALEQSSDVDGHAQLDLGAVRRNLLSPNAVSMFRNKAKMLTAIFVKFSDWTTDKLRLLEHRTMREEQFVEAVLNRGLELVEEGPGALRSIQPHDVMTLQATTGAKSPARDLSWPAAGSGKGNTHKASTPLAKWLDRAHLVRSETAVRAVFHVVSWTRLGHMKAAENIAAQLGVAISAAMLTGVAGEQLHSLPTEPTLRFSGFLEAVAAVSRVAFPSPWIPPDVKLSALLDVLEACHAEALSELPAPSP